MATDDTYVPHIMDSDMTEAWNADKQMFDPAAPLQEIHDFPSTPFDYAQYLNNEAFVSSPTPGQAGLPGYASPAKPFAPHSEPPSAPLQSHSSLQPRSHMSSSPDSSSQDSSSESSGRRKRKMTSSDSSPSALFDGMDNHMDGYTMIGLDAVNECRDSLFVKREPQDLLGLESDVDSINKTMASHFDVGSNSSSPTFFTFGSPEQTVVPSKLEQQVSRLLNA